MAIPQQTQSGEDQGHILNKKNPDKADLVPAVPSALRTNLRRLAFTAAPLWLKQCEGICRSRSVDNSWALVD